MKAIDIISDELPPLKTSDNGIKATEWMEDFKVEHLPVLNKGAYLGMISETELLDMADPQSSIGTSNPSLISTYVLAHQHIFDVIRTMTSANLTVIGVMDEAQNYLGAITLVHLMDEISNLAIVKDPGSIIILEMNVNDYSMSEISRIVESDDAKILGSFVTSQPDSTKIEVTIKVNKLNLGGIIQTFERYQYTIKVTYDQGDNDEYLQGRFDNFMNYLNI